MTHIKLNPLSVFISALTIPVAIPSWSQSSDDLSFLEEIVVTARKVQESEQDLPITVAAYSGNELEQKAVFDVQGMQAAAPGLQVSTSNQSGYPIFAIRGSETQNDVDGAVGIYFGDVPVLSTAAIANSFFDVASVEVLKGPQGTQFGANSTGGTVSIRPNLPTDEFEGHVKAGYGDYNRTEFEGIINVPVNDVLKFRLAGNYVERDGYIENKSAGGNIPDEFWDENHYSLRGSMRIETGSITSDTVVDYFNADELFQLPIPVLFVDPTFGFLPLSANPEAFGDRVGTRDTVYLAPNLTGLDRPLTTESDLWGIQHVLNIDVNDHFSIRNVTGYRDDDRAASERSGPTSVHTITVLTGEDSNRFVNDLTLRYEGMDGKLTLSGGAYYQDDERTYNIVAAAAQNIFFAGAAEPFIPAGTPVTSNIHIYREREVTSKAIYANLDYELTEKMTIGAGIRRNWDETALAYTPSTGFGLPDMGSNAFPDASTPCSFLDLAGYSDVDFDNCVGYRDDTFQEESWNLVLSYQVSDYTLTYAKVGKGYIAGTVNDNLREVPTVEPETQLQYEVGLKSDWQLAGRPIRTNLALYYGTIKDKQIVQNANYDDGATANGIINAAEETVQGLDLDIQYGLTDNVTLEVSYAYVDAQFDEFSFPALGGPVRTLVPAQDLSGEQPARVPEHQFNGTITYDLPVNSEYGEVTASLSAYYTSETRMVNVDTTGPFGDEYITLEDYWLTNGSINWGNIGGSSFSANLWVRNISDEEYAVARDAQFFTFGYASIRYGAPRTYGLNLTYAF